MLKPPIMMLLAMAGALPLAQGALASGEDCDARQITCVTYEVPQIPQGDRCRVSNCYRQTVEYRCVTEYRETVTYEERVQPVQRIRYAYIDP